MIQLEILSVLDQSISFGCNLKVLSKKLREFIIVITTLALVINVFMFSGFEMCTTLRINTSCFIIFFGLGTESKMMNLMLHCVNNFKCNIQNLVAFRRFNYRVRQILFLENALKKPAEYFLKFLFLFESTILPVNNGK